MTRTELCFTLHDYRRLRNLLEQTVSAAHLRLRGDLKRLTRDLPMARVIQPEDVPGDVVTINSWVLVKDLDSGEESRWLLTLPHLADIRQGRLSVLSPVGTALLGARTEEIVRWEHGPNRWGRIQVLKILFQPEAAGIYDL